MRERLTRRLDAIFLAATLWAWGLTGAYFWGLAKEVGAVLPHVPAAVWAGPGRLWQAAPWLLITAMIVATVLLARFPRAMRALRAPIVAAMALVVTVALVWGGALLAAARGLKTG